MIANGSVIALIFMFYILSFAVDLVPSVRTRRHVPQGEKRLEMARSGPNAPHHDDVVYEPPVVAEAADLNDNYYRGQRMWGA